ncbi:unnamed protein product [Bursaphelenchus xylophilus]|uniref:(pine wood nematode) hypothetical protein n=1 Tax=Bursaphelenchus xylophilus TaxID=6326 RepID=A0A1I7SGS4_BURXY|nr:unnamed protein product [Bursaphelenchus xylophilus]CAG9111471.1 unnamed protein product [Bursaphelenchus xylophilus]
MDRNSVTDIKSDVHSLLRWISDASLIRISQSQPRSYAKKPTNSWAKQSKLDEISSDQVYINNFGSINLP